MIVVRHKGFSKQWGPSLRVLWVLQGLIGFGFLTIIRATSRVVSQRTILSNELKSKLLNGGLYRRFYRGSL